MIHLFSLRLSEPVAATTKLAAVLNKVEPGVVRKGRRNVCCISGVGIHERGVGEN